MRTTLLALTLTFFSLSILNAQTPPDTSLLVNKKGIRILPQEGDFAIGIGANSILSYIGNMMNFSNNNSVSFTYPFSDNTIYGKYFIDNSTAIRAKSRLAFNNITKYNQVQDDINVATNPNSKVEDKYANSFTNVSLGFGIEKRKGLRRLQAVYGAELLLGVQKYSTNYTYGNAMTTTNRFPTSSYSDFTGSDRLYQRPLEESVGLSLNIGLRGFLGVEYFFSPKMSVAGEFGWGPNYEAGGKRIDKDQTTKASTSYPIQYTLIENKSEVKGTKIFSVDNDNASGQIVLLLYF